MIVKGILSVECEECGKIHDIGADESDFKITHREDRPMGQEKGYTWEKDFECDGNNNTCGNQIKVECEVWEYPNGQLSHEDTRANGATVISKYDYDLNEQPEPDDFE